MAQIFKCQGHVGNEKCLKCEKQDLSVTRFDVLCSENSFMINDLNKSKRENSYHIDDRFKRFSNLNVEKLSFSNGIFHFDFCNGARAMCEELCTIKMVDDDSDTVAHEFNAKPKEIYESYAKYFVNWRIEFWKDNKIIFQHKLDLQGKNVFVSIASKCLGDSLAWIDSIERFQLKHKCNIVCSVEDNLIDVFSNNFEMKFVSKDRIIDNLGYYAGYVILCGDYLYRDYACTVDRLNPLSYCADYALDIEHSDKIKKLKQNKNVSFGCKYICYSESASSKSKEWNNLIGWEKVIEYLQEIGYLCVSIDKEKQCDFNHVFYMNGNYTIQDRINVLSKAELYIGTPSGLAWLARACYVPAIVIGGFSLPHTEWNNPYRVVNRIKCFGCWNYLQKQCVCLYEGTSREYECGKSITAKQVIKMIDKWRKDKNELN